MYEISFQTYKWSSACIIHDFTCYISWVLLLKSPKCNITDSLTYYPALWNTVPPQVSRYFQLKCKVQYTCAMTNLENSVERLNIKYVPHYTQHTVVSWGSWFTFKHTLMFFKFHVCVSDNFVWNFHLHTWSEWPPAHLYHCRLGRKSRFYWLDLMCVRLLFKSLFKNHLKNKKATLFVPVTNTYPLGTFSLVL